MSRGKRIFWRIFSMILFILLVWAVVAGTDGIVGWIKQFFKRRGFARRGDCPGKTAGVGVHGAYAGRMTRAE